MYCMYRRCTCTGGVHECTVCTGGVHAQEEYMSVLSEFEYVQMAIAM